jgi:hypothetical protein
MAKFLFMHFDLFFVVLRKLYRLAILAKLYQGMLVHIMDSTSFNGEVSGLVTVWKPPRVWILKWWVANLPEGLAQFPLWMDHQQHAGWHVPLLSPQTHRTHARAQMYENQHSSIGPAKCTQVWSMKWLNYHENHLVFFYTL